MDLSALEAAAREVMEPSAYDYYAGGAETETTLRENVTAWERWRLRPHVLRNVADVTTATSLLGSPVTTPVGVAPAAYQQLAHPEGEAATARGCAAAGALMTVSTLATVSLEDVAAAAPDAPRWFQLYVFTDRGYAGELVERAVTAGYRAIILTVDTPMLGRRWRDERNGFALRDGMRMANVPLDASTGGDIGRGSGLAALFAEHDRGLTFDDVGWLRARAGAVPIVLKGVLRGDDARRGVDAGAAGIWVSNHGGRQLDRAVPTATALGEVADAVGDDAEIVVDGGVRRGVDVLTALALGARGVFVARPALWGLATGGAAGVREVLTGLTDDLAHAAALAGVPDVREVPRDLVTPA
ncbi:alpha-hydroxy acid oxidase [Nitriliruptor alkaliphilus]|uniref:alpha-hydroxy acid oxidase n=1 Tax=Nitriliruptor alkaliphilus TaxID=427918 RepID=UPI00069749F1|nr:alpha-hydroxy acid oxidase [Nitriliruptor alkaliphilus]